MCEGKLCKTERLGALWCPSFSFTVHCHLVGFGHRHPYPVLELSKVQQVLGEKKINRNGPGWWWWWWGVMGISKSDKNWVSKTSLNAKWEQNCWALDIPSLHKDSLGDRNLWSIWVLLKSMVTNLASSTTVEFNVKWICICHYHVPHILKQQWLKIESNLEMLYLSQIIM